MPIAPVPNKLVTPQDFRTSHVLINAPKTVLNDASNLFLIARGDRLGSAILRRVWFIAQGTSVNAICYLYRDTAATASNAARLAAAKQLTGTTPSATVAPARADLDIDFDKGLRSDEADFWFVGASALGAGNLVAFAEFETLGVPAQLDILT